MRADFISARKGIKSSFADLLSARFVIKYAVADFMTDQIVLELYEGYFMPFRAAIKFQWQFVGKILGGGGGKCVTLSAKREETKDYVVLFMEAKAAEEVQGQAAVDAGRGVHLALHGAAAV